MYFASSVCIAIASAGGCVRAFFIGSKEELQLCVVA